ncbi:hypothetical protein LINPERPRIM_LOCUS11073 [Linum perenne]
MKLWANKVTQPYKRFLKAEATKNNQDFDSKEFVVPPRAWALERRPPNVPAPMWTQYVDLRLSEHMVELSQLNSLRRAEYKSPHTGGSKKLRVRGSELEDVLGKRPTRGELYAISHKKKDGTYTDPNVILELLKDPTILTWVSSNDALGQVYHIEHSGRVQGLGFGATPTKVNLSKKKGVASQSSRASDTAMHDFGHCPVQGEVAELRDEVRVLKEQIAHLTSGASGSSTRDKGKGKTTLQEVEEEESQGEGEDDDDVEDDEEDE